MSGRRTWTVWDPTTGQTSQRTQRTRPREHARAVVVDSWPADDPMPVSSDARDWDAWRARLGCSGVRS